MIILNKIYVGSTQNIIPKGAAPIFQKIELPSFSAELETKNPAETAHGILDGQTPLDKESQATFIKEAPEYIPKGKRYIERKENEAIYVNFTII